MVSAKYYREWRAEKRLDPAWVERQRRVYREYVARKKKEDPEWWEERYRKKRESYFKHRKLKPKKLKQTREERQLERQQYYHRVKSDAIHAYGGKCACCGEANVDCLTIDHVNNGRPEGKKLHGMNLYAWVKRNNHPAGYRTLCMNCNIAYGMYHYCPHKSRPQIKLSKMQRILKKRKSLVVDGYGGKCVECGEDAWEFLQIHHPNNDGSIHRKNKGAFYVWLISKGYLKDFELLCANCHTVKQYVGKSSNSSEISA